MGNQRGGGTMSGSEAARINQAISRAPATTRAMSQAEAKALGKDLFRGVVKVPAASSQSVKPKEPTEPKG
jgi:hypothetical protein